MNELEMVDADHAVSPLTMPGGRDLQDITMHNENGTEWLIASNKALTYIAEDAIPAFTGDITEVPLHTKQASWFTLSDSACRTILMDIPEHAAVYVYDAYDRMVYSSYMLDYGNAVPLPKEGKIVFLGEDGGSIHITQ